MPFSTPKKNSLLPSLPSLLSSESGLAHDITWGRPLFRPPVLNNPRTIFDPLPFTSQRSASVRRQTAKA